MSCRTLLMVCVATMAFGVIARADDAPERFLDGVDLLSQARFADSLAALDDAIRLDPHQAIYHLNRAVDLIMLRRPEDANAALDAAAAIDRHSVATAVWSYVGRMTFTDAPLGQGMPADSIMTPLEQKICVAADDCHRAGIGADSDSWNKLTTLAAQYASSEYGNVAIPAAAQRVDRLYASGNFASCATILDRIRQWAQVTSKTLLFDANCKLQIGDIGAARDMYTQVLIENCDWWQPYVGRAKCEIALGDLRDAKDDLALAAQINSKDAATEIQNAEAQVTAASGQQIRDDPASLREQFDHALDTGQSDDVLLPIATRLLQVRFATRHIAAEDFTRQRTVLTLAFNRDPSSPTAALALAEFLLQPRVAHQISTPAGEITSDVPCSPGVHDDNAQIDRLLASVLAAQPQNRQALESAALLAARENRPDDEKKSLDAALQLGNPDFKLAALYADCYTADAQQDDAQANQLRQSWTRTWETTSNGVVTHHTSGHAPSPQDLQQAADLDAQSDQLRRQAAGPMQQVIQSTRGSTDRVTASYYDLACAYYLSIDNRFEEAFKHARAAVDTDPYNIDALDFLSNFAAAHGNADLAATCDDEINNVINPSPIGWLINLRSDLRDSRINDARQHLANAMKEDPTSVANFLAKLDLDEAMQSSNEEIRDAHAVEVLEEARLGLLHRTLNPSAPGTITPQDALIAVDAHVRAGEMLARLGQQSAAIDQFKRASAIARRVSWDTVYSTTDPLDAASSSQPVLGPETPPNLADMLQTVNRALSGQPFLPPSPDNRAPQRMIRG